MTTKQKKISVQTLGCRLNQYESEKIAAQLYPYGFKRAKQTEPADIYIINTCTVTHKADADCRAMIRRASRQNPNSKIVVTGCYVDNDPALIEGMEAVDLIVNNAQKDDIANIRSEEHTSELQSHSFISYAVFCLKKKKKQNQNKKK